jgi:hypothetical protein
MRSGPSRVSQKEFARREGAQTSSASVKGDVSEADEKLPPLHQSYVKKERMSRDALPKLTDVQDGRLISTVGKQPSLNRTPAAEGSRCLLTAPRMLSYFSKQFLSILQTNSIYASISCDSSQVCTSYRKIARRLPWGSAPTRILR